MRRGWALLLALLLAPLSGCFTVDPEPAITRREAQLPFAPPADDDTVVLEVALLECPVSDPYINGPLWDFVDETANAARKTVLHDNGFRMGNLGSTLPEPLVDLITSERNASNIRERRMPAGNPAPLPIGPTWTQCRFDLLKDDEPLRVELDRAQCVLEVVPTPADDGRTSLKFTPLVRHGETRLEPRPVQDPSGVMRWDLQANPSIERYPWLSWELTAAANEYVVIGTEMDHPGTLGHRTFLHTESVSPVQRLLVLRVIRAQHGEFRAEDQGKSPPPLALQAGWFTARGAGPSK